MRCGNEISANDFGTHNMVDIMKNKHNRKANELFFSIEARDKNGDYKRNKFYGYMELTEKMLDFVKHEFFTGCGGIEFIQWKNCWNVVFNEQSIIGGISCKMSFKEFNKLFANIKSELEWGV